MCAGDNHLDLCDQGGRIHLIAQGGCLCLELFYLLVGCTVDLVQLLSCVIDQLSALVYCASHRSVAVPVVLHFNAVVHVHHVHRVDRLSRVFR
jgi:hypothetical protein